MPPPTASISAIITTRNRSPLLGRAIQSVLRQTLPPVEIVVVDDASTDETQTIIERLRETNPQIIYVRNDTRMGASASRNIGIGAAGGHYVAGLDDDDEWHPHRLEKLAAGIRPEDACVTSDVVMLTGSRRRVWRKKKTILLSDLLYSNQVGNQVMVARSRVLEIGGFDESLDAAQDYDVWIRLCERFGPIRNVQEPLQTIHMEHAMGRITSSEGQFRGYMQFFNKHRRLMTRSQRRYQLYLIRRKTGRPVSPGQAVRMIPPRRWLKELSGWLMDRKVPD